MDRIPRVREVQVTGPYNPIGVSDTPSRKRILICTPPERATSAQEVACATEIVKNIARRAYRRPATDEDITAPLNFFKDARANGSFEAGIESAVTLILSSPKFLYRAEEIPVNAKPGTTFPICIAHPNYHHIFRGAAHRPSIAKTKTGSCFPGDLCT